MMARPRITAIRPIRALEGGRVSVAGDGLPSETIPRVRLGDEPARVVFASSSRITFIVPPGLDGGTTPVRVEELPGETVSLSVGTPWAAGLHQVDNPVLAPNGDLFVTYSGSRGQHAPVSIFRVTAEGVREPFVSGIVNATSMAFGPDGSLYVSSRFDGAVYRVAVDGTYEQVASDLGVACGIAFDADGVMHVGDRSGTVFRVVNGEAMPLAVLPASVAAYHLAMSPAGELFVSAPTLGSYDHIHRISRDGTVQRVPAALGRPQGLAFAPDGALHVVDALAGDSGVYRFSDLDKPPELVVSGQAMVGIAFGPGGEIVVASNDTAYRFD